MGDQKSDFVLKTLSSLQLGNNDISVRYALDKNQDTQIRFGFGGGAEVFLQHKTEIMGFDAKIDAGVMSPRTMDFMVADSFESRPGIWIEGFKTAGEGNFLKVGADISSSQAYAGITYKNGLAGRDAINKLNEEDDYTFTAHGDVVSNPYGTAASASAELDYFKQRPNGNTVDAHVSVEAVANPSAYYGYSLGSRPDVVLGVSAGVEYYNKKTGLQNYFTAASTARGTSLEVGLGKDNLIEAGQVAVDGQIGVGYGSDRIPLSYNSLGTIESYKPTGGTGTYVHTKVDIKF